MELSISPVKPEDVDMFIRKVNYPAQQDSPLYRLIFSKSKTEHQREEEIKWTVDGLFEAVYANDEVLYKACMADGSPVGLIGWTTSPGAIDGAKPEAKHGTKKSSQISATMDVTTWVNISKTPREERQRVFRSREGREIRRKSTPLCPEFAHESLPGITFMAVDPDCQRQGIVSMLMELFCSEMDEQNSDAFVMSSPAGVPLYSKFGIRGSRLR